MVYLHIPFCKSFCTYCAFYSEIFSSELAVHYEVAVKAELRSREAEIRKTLSTPTLYIGGGTPSVLPPDVLRRLVEAVAKVTGGHYREFTIEVNPDDVTPDYASFLKGLGVTRVSMGVQSFDDRILARMHRRHTAEGARRAFGCLRESGFDNISVDLIFGLGGPVREGTDGVSAGGVWSESPTLESDLDALLSLPGGPPEHISAYQLSLEEGSALYEQVRRGRYLECADEEAARQYGMVCDRLRAAGYEHYEISNFAFSGADGMVPSPYRALHNSAYWSGAPYVGLGPAAHSYDGISRRSWNPADLTTYISSWEKDGLNGRELEFPGHFREGCFNLAQKNSSRPEPCFEFLTPEQRAMERVMLALRTADGIPEVEIRRLCSDDRVDALLRQTYLEKSRINANLRIPEQHGFISDTIIAELV
ncbi:MAG: coproporphyrinogen III oxidase family protein [Bacteroidales bacterium]|nr:coproporphyrinogen III oxidase family protein [Bacteroidales bacterium]